MVADDSDVGERELDSILSRLMLLDDIEWDMILAEIDSFTRSFTDAEGEGQVHRLSPSGSG